MIDGLFNILCQGPGGGVRWAFWPFSPGYGQHWTVVLAKLAFISLILGLIFLYVRFLFGPNGRFRDKELDREAEEQRINELEELERDHDAGRISDMDYKWRKKRLEE